MRSKMKHSALPKAFLLSCLAVTISACSGGGGNGGGNSASPEPVQPVAQKPSEVKPTPTTKPTNATHNPAENPQTPSFIAFDIKAMPPGEVNNEDVGFGKVTGYNNQYSFSGAFKEHEPLGSIVVDNVKLQLARGLSGVGGLQGKAIATAFESAWNAALKNPNREIFYFGAETPATKMENLKGTATYKGVATRYDNVTGDLQNIGSSTLNADFDNKKISGELDISGIWRRNISLKEAEIKGNAFEGQAIAGENHILRTVEGKYEGKFFGPNAEEVAGKATFEGEAIIGNGLRDLDTSFSGKKQ